MGFPGGSGGKESACNAGDPGSISELGRSLGEGIGYTIQYSWASLCGSPGNKFKSSIFLVEICKC